MKRTIIIDENKIKMKYVNLRKIRCVWLFSQELERAYRNLRHEYSRCIGICLFFAWTPNIASIGTSVRGIETACGGK